MDKRHIHEKLTELEQSEAWHYMCQQMENEIYSAISNMSKPGKPFTEEAIHYTRGCIFSAERLLLLPSLLKSKLESDIRIADASKTNPEDSVKSMELQSVAPPLRPGITARLGWLKRKGTDK